MGLIKCIKKDDNGSEIRYYCSDCNQLLEIIYQPYNCYITLDFPNNCPNCNKQITQPITVYEPIIDETKYE